MIGYSSNTDKVALIPNNTPSATVKGRPLDLPEARCLFRFDVLKKGTAPGTIASADGTEISEVPVAKGSYFFFKNRTQGLKVIPGKGQTIDVYYR
jgi:hypothetical protein